VAEIVAAFGLSHAALMLREWNRATEPERAAVKAGFDSLRERLRAAQPDTLIIIANDHFNTFSLHNMPAFAVGLGARVRGHGDGGLPAYDIPGNSPLGYEILEALSNAGYAPAFSIDMAVDHAFVTPLHLLTPEMDIPIVPIFQNCNAPPMPPFDRCYELGGALRYVINSSSCARRVAILGTGGISHEVPLPDWRPLLTSGAHSPWLAHMTGNAEGVRAEVTQEILEWSKNGLGRINEAFDRKLLRSIELRDHDALTSLTTDEVARLAGNGAQELRNWVTMLGTVPDYAAKVVFYQPVAAWLTGIGGVALTPV
jgi:aromatic ring-opening dioxygenase catalytic subunit (LigB family)